jgi:hypothetical protein
VNTLIGPDLNLRLFTTDPDTGGDQPVAEPRADRPSRGSALSVADDDHGR